MLKQLLEKRMRIIREFSQCTFRGCRVGFGEVVGRGTVPDEERGEAGKPIGVKVKENDLKRERKVRDKKMKKNK